MNQQTEKKIWGLLYKLYKTEMSERYDDEGMDIYSDLLELIDQYFTEINSGPNVDVR